MLDIKVYIALWCCIVVGGFLEFFVRVKMPYFNGHILYNSIVVNGVERGVHGVSIVIKNT